MNECESAYLDVPQNPLELVIADFQGGIGLWGALPAVYDTRKAETPPGVHVHARKTVDGPKVIDNTFDHVSVLVPDDLFEQRRVGIGAKAAVNYFITRAAGLVPKHLFCTHCGELHLDAGQFAVKPHKKHLCHACGRHFVDSQRAVSNPISYLRHYFQDLEPSRKRRRAQSDLEIDQKDFPGGIEVWASNPAVFWTVPRPEDEGIHVHAYRTRGPKRAIDDTYSRVVIDGLEINETPLRLLMAQKALPFLKNKLTVLKCPHCHVPCLDDGVRAFNPARYRRCRECGAEVGSFGKQRLVISNPIIETLQALRAANATK